MGASGFAVVTGAFGYSGRYITQRLLARGERVVTLTGHPERENPFGNQVEARSFSFDDPDQLRRNLEGATTLYNTFWVRYAHKKTTYDWAVEGTKTMVAAAKDVGVKRMVHASITKPSLDSPLPYFRGKAELEKAIHESGLSYAILRPAVLFGDRDVLINNMAWFLRRFPFIMVPGNGQYGIQPMHVEDYADLAVEQGLATENVTIDAVGVEQYTFEGLLRTIAEKIGQPARICHAPPTLALWASSIIGWFVKDVVLTRQEILGLLDGLLSSSEPPTGPRRLSEYIEANAETVGREYACELARHFQ